MGPKGLTPRPGGEWSQCLKPQEGRKSTACEAVGGARGEDGETNRGRSSRDMTARPPADWKCAGPLVPSGVYKAGRGRGRTAESGSLSRGEGMAWGDSPSPVLGGKSEWAGEMQRG